MENFEAATTEQKLAPDARWDQQNLWTVDRSHFIPNCCKHTAWGTLKH